MNSDNNWADIIQNILAPPTCLLCGLSDQVENNICGRCRHSLPYVRNACGQCGTPLEFKVIDPATRCGTCMRVPPPFDQTLSVLHYTEPVRHLVRTLKFHADVPSGILLGSLLADKLDSDRTPDWPQLIIPVPLHFQRYRQRGFNQAAVIAAQVSKRLGIPVGHRICDRTRATHPQSGLHAPDRRKNLKNAFRIHPVPDIRHVAIIDDVITTGATVRELSRILKASGIKRILVWSCARA